jgi:hypothetical protein
VIRFEQASQLTTIGDTLYIGFNETIESIRFDALVSVAGALIIEHNPALRELHLPKLTHVGKYIHIHDNGMLQQVHLPALQQVVGELSALRNGDQVVLTIARADAAATVASTDVDAPSAWIQVSKF